MFFVLFLILVGTVSAKPSDKVLKGLNQFKGLYSWYEAGYDPIISSCENEWRSINADFEIAKKNEKFGKILMDVLFSRAESFYKTYKSNGFLLRRINHCIIWQGFGGEIDKLIIKHKLNEKANWKAKATKALENARYQRSAFGRIYENKFRKFYKSDIKFK